MPDYTREQPKELALPPRLPLVGLPNQRGASVEQDSRLVNCYVEFGQDEVLRIVKRPGIVERYALAGDGAGLFGHLSIFYVAGESTRSAKLYTDDTLEETFGGYLVGSPAGRFFSFITAPTGNESSVTFFHNTYRAYTWDGSNLVTLPFSLEDPGDLTCGITSGLTAVTTADTSTLTVYTEVSGTGITAGTYITEITSSTAFVISAQATATNGSATLSFVSAGPPSRLPDVALDDYPQLVDGVSVLNKAVYLFSRQSKLAGADADAPTAWNQLNYLYAYVEQDQPIALARQLTHLIALKSTSTEFFRDIGNSPGSPLERLEGLHLDIGCHDGRTVQSIDGILLWHSDTESGLRSVYAMERLRAAEIATPAIKRALKELDPQYAISFSLGGHSFYILTDPTAGVSLGYDLTSKLWSYWNALGETHFPFIAATYVDGETRLQHETNGKIYAFDADAVDDDGSPIVMDIFPPQFDGNTRLSKYIARMHLLADQETNSRLLVRSTDADQSAGSWTNWREFDMADPRPTLTNCGSFTKRFYHFRHQERTPCRLTAVELEMSVGTL